jgi:hypothetical protein
MTYFSKWKPAAGMKWHLVPAICKDELVKLRNTEWNEETKQLVEHIPTLQSCKGRMYNERHKILPPLPITTEDININSVWTQTTIGESFVLADDDTNGRKLCFSHICLLFHVIYKLNNKFYIDTEIWMYFWSRVNIIIDYILVIYSLCNLDTHKFTWS